ncbi:response regulator [Paraflavisolibacter sp. H34]|uniref:response regulator n=1 Tax=Huijunlia imazamoxiresistens TaxID=3127457 RepID=UPI00301B16DE
MQNGIPFSILVVDDDADDRLFIDEAFMEIGYAAEVKKFIDGKGLLRYLEQIEPALYPSLIVLDNTLPGLEAGDLLVILKAHPCCRSIPVVVYTSSVTAFMNEQLLSQGAYTVMEKASSTQEIVQVALKLKSLAERQRNVDDGPGGDLPLEAAPIGKK